MNDLSPQVRAAQTHQRILMNGNMAAQSLLEMAKDLKVMRDEKLYKEFGYETFEAYTEQSVGIKQSNAYNYIKVVESFPEDSFQSIGNFGIRKLELIARLPEPERQGFIDSNPIEDMTTRELQQAIKEKKELIQLLSEERSKPERVIEKVIEKEVIPVDYEELKHKASIADQEILKLKNEKAQAVLQGMKSQELQKKLDDSYRIRDQLNAQLMQHGEINVEQLNSMRFRTTISGFIQTMAKSIKEAEGYIEFTNSNIAVEQTERMKRELRHALDVVNQWKSGRVGGITDVEYQEV